MKIKASVTLALCAVLSLALIGSASAGLSASVSVKVKPVSDTKLSFSGKVKATDPKCEAGRKIVLRAGGKRLAKTRTDSRGKFSTVGKRPRPGATIKLKVKRKGKDCPKLIGTGVAP